MSAPAKPVDYRRLEKSLQAHLGSHAVASCSSTDGDISTLAPVECKAIARAVSKRQKEFAAGRAAAREAMARLGRPAVAIPMQHDRSPQWPADLVGSISHAHSTCIVVVARKPHWKAIGVDVEQDCDLASELWKTIGNPSELQQMSTLQESMRARWMMRIFSAKEAYYKCVYPRVLRALNFHDVEINMKPTLEGTEFHARPLHRESGGIMPDTLSGRILAEQGTLVSLVCC